MTDRELLPKLGFLHGMRAADPGEPRRPDDLLAGLCEAMGYGRAGLVWPAPPQSELVASSSTSRTREPEPPKAIVEQLAGRATGASAADPGDGRRRWATFEPVPGKPGLLWAEIGSDAEWDAADTMLFELAAFQVGGASVFNALRERESREARDAQRLHDAATVSGRIAHDLDNLWTGIVGFAELTLPLLDPDLPAHQYVSEITAVAQRGIQMTAQLHQFSRSGAARPMPSSLKTAVERERQRLAAAGVAADWEIRVPDDLPAVAIESGALQVLLGQLAANAREACPNAPVRVEAQRRTLSGDEAARYRGGPGPGSYVELTVADSGPGVRDEAKPRLFAEPFYTTKVRHRGVGLAITYRTVRAHRGGVRIETGPTGTAVRVLLPVADRAAAPPELRNTIGGLRP